MNVQPMRCASKARRGMVILIALSALFIGGLFLAGRYHVPFRRVVLDPNFDSNHNGEITQGEYVSSGMRATRRLGTANTLHNRVNRLRLQTRFRRADRNGDGRLTRDELGRIGDPRF